MKSRLRFQLASLACVWLLVLLTGCGNDNAPTPATTTTTPTPTSTPTPTGGSAALSNTYLYAATGGGIAGFAVNPSTGAMTSVPETLFAASRVADLGGGVLVAAGPGANSTGEVAAFQVNSSTGALSQLAVTVVNGNMFSLTAEPSRRVAYVGTSQGIYALRFNGSSFATVSGSPFAGPAGPDPTQSADAVALDTRPGADVLAAGIAPFRGAVIAAFAIAGDGALTRLATVGSNHVADVALHPSDKIVFDLDPGLALNSAVLSGNSLTTVQHTFFSGIRDLEAHPGGGYFVASDDLNGNKVHVFTVASSGTFTEVGGSPFSIAGSGAFRMKFDSSGQWLAIANGDTLTGTNSHEVVVASFDATNGIVRSVANTAVSGTPASVAWIKF